MKLDLPEKKVFIGPARVWKRILAFVLDLFVIDFFVLSFFQDVADKMLGSGAGFMTTYQLLENNPSQANALFGLFMMMILLVLAYFVLLQYAAGQTIGCILFNIYVVAETGDKQFDRAGFWQCLLRNLFLIPAVPFIFLWIIDPLYLAFARNGQRFTEWLSRTRVIEQITI